MSDGGPALKCYVILNDVIVDILTHPFLQVTHSCPRQECWSRQPIRIAHFEVRKHFSLDSFMTNRHQGCVNPIHCHPINQSFPSRPIKKLQTVTHCYCIKCMPYFERRWTFDCWIFTRNKRKSLLVNVIPRESFSIGSQKLKQVSLETVKLKCSLRWKFDEPSLSR